MSGYASGIVAILCINLIFAYAVFITAAAGTRGRDQQQLSSR